MVRWNLAELYEGITDRMGDEPAIIDGNRVFTWAELDRRADTVAADMLAHGLGQGARVGGMLFATAMTNMPPRRNSTSVATAATQNHSDSIGSVAVSTVSATNPTPSAANLATSTGRVELCISEE